MNFTRRTIGKAAIGLAAATFMVQAPAMAAGIVERAWTVGELIERAAEAPAG